MWIHLVNAFAVCNAHHLQKLNGTGFDLFFALSFAVMQLDYFFYLFTDTKNRIQGSHGLLENHGHIIAAQLLHFLHWSLCNIICLIPQV